MNQHVRPALTVFAALSVVTGIVYPLVITLIAQGVFPRQANGSIIEHNGKGVGSELIGQPFDDPRYFWGRPSATVPAYNGAASMGSNLGPTNPAQLDNVKARIEALAKADPEQTGPVPIDLVTASASGLDPHISPAAADYQVGRVARTRGLTKERVRELVVVHTEERTLGVLGEPRVNVLRLNLALDDAEKESR